MCPPRGGNFASWSPLIPKSTTPGPWQCNAVLVVSRPIRKLIIYFHRKPCRKLERLRVCRCRPRYLIGETCIGRLCPYERKSSPPITRTCQPSLASVTLETSEKRGSFTMTVIRQEDFRSE